MIRVFNHKFPKLIGLLLILLITSTCSSDKGSDSNGELLTGQFIDSPVQGLTYKTNSREGLTNTDGAFSYLPGETVQFFLGDKLLGATLGNEILSPFDLSDAEQPITNTTLNIARILQSLDTDEDPTNGITLPDDLSFIEEGLDISDESAIQSVLSALDTPITLVSATQAQSHVIESLNTVAHSTSETSEYETVQVLDNYYDNQASQCPTAAAHSGASITVETNEDTEMRVFNGYILDASGNRDYFSTEVSLGDASLYSGLEIRTESLVTIELFASKETASIYVYRTGGPQDVLNLPCIDVIRLKQSGLANKPPVISYSKIVNFEQCYTQSASALASYVLNIQFKDLDGTIPSAPAITYMINGQTNELLPESCTDRMLCSYHIPDALTPCNENVSIRFSVTATDNGGAKTTIDNIINHTAIEITSDQDSNDGMSGSYLYISEYENDTCCSVTTIDYGPAPEDSNLCFYDLDHLTVDKQSDSISVDFSLTHNANVGADASICVTNLTHTETTNINSESTEGLILVMFDLTLDNPLDSNTSPEVMQCQLALLSSLYEFRCGMTYEINDITYSYNIAASKAE